MTTITAAININGAGEIESSASSTSQHHQHITAERLSIGYYRITGVLSLASSGWRTSIPRDDNAQPMFMIETTDDTAAQTLDVLVTRNNEPVDIADGRVLTLRMDATEPPVVEIEEPEEPLIEADE